MAKPDEAPAAGKKKSPLAGLLTALKKLPAAFKGLSAVLKILPAALAGLSGVFKGLAPALAGVTAALKGLPIPKKLLIPVIAGAVLLIAGGVTFGVLHARSAHAAVAVAKTAAAAPVAAPAEPCGGVVRDIYRQTQEEDPSVTLADVRAEVLSSGISCAPDPELAADLKDLSPACRDMVQYTFLGVREGHTNIRIGDVREKVVQKSVACEHDRPANIASDGRHRGK